MKRHVIHVIGLMLSVLLVSVSCGQKSSIEGKIENLGDDTLFVSVLPVADYLKIKSDYDVLKDTTVSVNNKFTCNLPYSGPVIVHISAKKSTYGRLSGGVYVPESGEIRVFWKPGDKIKIKGKLEGYTLDYEIEGNELNRENSLIRRKYLENLSEAARIEMKMDTLMFYNPNPDIKVSEDSVRHRDAIINNLFKLRTELTSAKRKPLTDYVLNNPAKELSGYLMAFSLPADTVGKYCDKLDNAVKNGLFKDIIDSKVKRYNDYVTVQKNREKIQPGKLAPDFTLKSFSGNDISLYSIQKEYVALDFWGSWCGWCIAGYPKMKEYYAKYKKRMEFLGIACRDTEEAWKNAVRDNQLEWIQAINDPASDVSVKYAVEGYPTKIILDRDKKIVEVFIGESDKFYQKLDELLK